MSRPRHLPNAPIAEAVLDIRVKTRGGATSHAFEPLRALLGTEFPIAKEQREGRVMIQLPKEGAGPVVEDLGVRGLFFHSADERLIAQFRLDGFTLNRLAPYTSWEEIASVAHRLWDAFVASTVAESVTRVALRYINRITLPADTKDLGEYLAEPPRVPAGVPQAVSAFYSRMSLRDADSDRSAHVAQTLETTNDDLVWVLDIDAYRDTPFWPPDAPAVWAALHDLRDFKNQIFFSSLTEKAIGRFE